MKYTSIVVSLLVLVGVFSFSSRAEAAVIPTGNTCSLSEAILSAELDMSVSSCIAGSGSDTIQVNQDEVITSIPSGDFPDGQNAFKTIASTVSIVGNGHSIKLLNNTLTSGRMFNVISGGVLNISNLNFKNLGSTAPSMEDGGFLYAEGAQVGLTNVSIDGFRATSFGGAIFSSHSTINISKSRFSNNKMTSSGFILGGGALFLDSGNLKVSGSTFTNNSSGGQGGAILTVAGFDNFSITESVFTTNSADYGSAISAGDASFGKTIIINLSQFENNTSNSGGAFVWRGADGAVTISNSTFEGNHGLSSGAALQNDGNSNTLTVINSTFSGNGSTGVGSAVLNTGNNNTFMFGYDTFVKNTGSGAIFKSFSMAPWNNSVLENSIFSENLGGDCGLASSVNFTKTNNLSSDGTCGQSSATGVSSTLDLNGSGVVRTHALLAGSNAIDHAITDPAIIAIPCPQTDERGVVRPLDGNADGVATCDIGAFEFKTKYTTVSTVGKSLKQPIK